MQHSEMRTVQWKRMWLNTFIQGLAKLWGGINTSALQCIGEQGKIEERKIKTEEQSVQSSVQRGISREVVERYQCSVERRAVCKEVSVQCKVAAKWEALDAALVVTDTHSARLVVIVQTGETIATQSSYVSSILYHVGTHL